MESGGQGGVGLGDRRRGGEEKERWISSHLSF